MKTLKELASKIGTTTACFCDFDNYQAEETGHSMSCQIHKKAMKQWHEEKINAYTENRQANVG